MIDLCIESYPLEFWAEKLNRDEVFAFSRWGDGEWACLLGDDGQTCDGQVYSAPLAAALRKALTSRNPVYKGWLAVARRAGEQRIQTFLDQHDPIVWVDGDVFLTAALKGRFHPMVSALYGHRVGYVGPAHLQGLDGVLGMSFRGFVTVPDHNAYAEYERILTETHRLITELRCDVVGFSCGPLANILVNAFAGPLTGHTTTLIDFGSLFDPFVGVQSRSYAKRGDWATLNALNTGGM